MRANDLWTWQGTLGRGEYVRWGLLLYALKYNLDRLVATVWFHSNWYPWSYLVGTREPASPARQNSSHLLPALLVFSLPFIFWGVIMTLRRLRDAGWPRTLVVLFFVPFINLLFFTFLGLQPRREPLAALPPPLAWWRRAFFTQSPVAAAALGIAASVMLGLGLTVFGTAFLKNYGLGIFIGTPFMMGFFSALFYGVAGRRTWGECALVATISVMLVGGLLIVLAVEGLICILMAAPIGFALALLGATAAWAVQAERWPNRPRNEVRLYAAAWLVAPCLFALEVNPLPSPAPLVAVTTACEIAMPPETVWRHVVSFGELPPPTEKLFLAGIAYPVRARLEGRGVGAVRYCEFSTGPFVEPITAWEENHRLAFAVSRQPHPMREWSPYAKIQPAHLEGFFLSRRGEFRLTALPGGRTWLEGTTWYQQEIWPQAYWQPWSDYLIHVIHRRVLQHIKAEAERDRL